MGGNSHDHLLATQQGVADELASAKRHGSVVVRHVCDILSCGGGGGGRRWNTKMRVRRAMAANLENSDPPVSLNWVQP